MFLELIDLNFNLKVAGTTTVHNATTVENDTYTWDYSTILREGINFEYSIESNDSTGLNDSTNTNDTTTGPNYLILGTIGAIAIQGCFINRVH